MKRGRSFWRTSCAETFPFPSMNYTLLTAPRWLTSYDRLIPRNRRRGPTFSSNNSRGNRLIIQRLSNFTISSWFYSPDSMFNYYCWTFYVFSHSFSSLFSTNFLIEAWQMVENLIRAFWRLTNPCVVENLNWKNLKWILKLQITNLFNRYYVNFVTGKFDTCILKINKSLYFCVVTENLDWKLKFVMNFKITNLFNYYYVNLVTGKFDKSIQIFVFLYFCNRKFELKVF